jgi:predicted alpha-1,2-mannosidase
MERQKMSQPTKVAALLFLLSCLTVTVTASAREADPARWVNPFIGTGGHGHTFPGAVLPFGMVQLSPDTRLSGWDGCSGYHDSDRLIYGFSHTHLSGTGVADLCDILLMPVSNGGQYLNNTEYASPFRKETETAEPGYYRLFLDKPGVLAEMTATPRVGLHRYTFAKGKSAGLLIDLEHRDPVLDSWIRIVSPTEIHGYRRSSSWAKDQQIYFALRLSQPLLSASPDSPQALRGKKVRTTLHFAPSTSPLLVKVGLSSVGVDGAVKNLEAEAPGWDFDAKRHEARSAWNRELGRIEVSGGNSEQLTSFYSALYHCFIHPSLWSDADGRYRGHDGQIHKTDGFEVYTVFSLWDTFRTLHPLLNLIMPRRSQDFIRTFLDIYQQGGLLPVWELHGNETFCMIGYHSVPVILDAWVKGIRGFDPKRALEAMRHSANQNHFGLDAYRANGHIAADMDHEGVSKTLEYAYDDACIAEFARLLGEEETAREFWQRAQYYQNTFDPRTGFMRPRQNGGWKTPFEPGEVDFNFTEANSWQYSFFVPQDITGLMKLHGGADKLEQKLDELFQTAQSLSGRQQSDITGLIGQYAHGNEPSHHMAYLYNFLGSPHKTQARVRQIMDSLYHPRPDGLCGNEDCGQMSAWLVMSALGLYPVTPGRPEYVLSAPWFERAVIHLENGRSFTIEAPQVGPNTFYIQQASLNGQPHSKSFISHDSVAGGGDLIFTMGAQPGTKWGTAMGDRPQSAIMADPIVTVPIIRSPGPTFEQSIQISLEAREPGVRLRYTLDGREPDFESALYEGPLTLTTSATVKAVSFTPEGRKSPTARAEFHRVDSRWTIGIPSQANPQYTAGGPKGLIDGLRGRQNFRLGGWQGYQDQDFEGIVDMGGVVPVKRIAAGFLQDTGSWILMPTSVEFWISEDGKAFTLAGRAGHKIPETEMTPVTADLELRLSARARFIKIIARNFGKLPAWHLGAGSPAFIFIDEIYIEPESAADEKEPTAMKAVIQITVEADSGPVTPDHQWHEVLILSPQQAELTRIGRSETSLIQSGHWTLSLEQEASRAFFASVSAIDFSVFKRREPPVSPDGGGTVSYTLVRADGQTTCLNFDPGTDYPGSEALVSLIRAFISDTPFPPSAKPNRF